MKKYKVKMTESQLEGFKLYLEESKKTKKKVIKEEMTAEDSMYYEDDEEVDDDEDEVDSELTIDEMQQKLIDLGIATEDEITLVTNINGYNEESMLDILYARTGYRNFDQAEN